MNALFLLNLLTLLAAPFAAFAHHDAPAPAPATVPDVHVEMSPSDERIVRLAVNHTGAPLDAVLQIKDAAGNLLALRTLTLEEGVTTLSVGVPPGEYAGELDAPGIAGRTHLDTNACRGRIVQGNLHTEREPQLLVLGTFGIRVEKASCPAS